jgi:hypothetical protein
MKASEEKATDAFIGLTDIELAILCITHIVYSAKAVPLKRLASAL